MSIDSRGGCGPAWSPDGTKMAAIYEGVLAVWPVSPAGEPLGPPRRITSESAHAPSWSGDSRHILYQSIDKLRIVDVETGDIRTVPLDLKYTPAIPTTRLLVHAGTLVDMKSAAAAHQRRHRHRGQQDHQRGAARRRRTTPAQVVDASNLTVMPGLIEFHSHLQPDFGESAGPRLAGVRHHHRAQPRQHAVRAGRGARGQRSQRPDRARASTAPAT